MSDLIPDKILSIFLHNPAYERGGFRMWGRILKRYNPRGKDALFESVSALYTLEKAADDMISAYMSRVRRLFIGLHGVSFNTMANLFIIVNSDHSRFGALTDCFRFEDPKVVNIDVNRLKNASGSDGVPLPRLRRPANPHTLRDPRILPPLRPHTSLHNKGRPPQDTSAATGNEIELPPHEPQMGRGP